MPPSLPPRSATVERATRETQIRVTLTLDRSADTVTSIETPSGFLSHMLDALARHGGLGLELHARGDTHIDDHHTVEDIGIVLGQAFKLAIGDAAGIRRFAHAYAPLDGSLVRAVVDISGRPHLSMDVPFLASVASGGSDPRGGFDFALLRDFLQGFVDNARLTLHLDLLRSDASNHHRAEASFKALALALRQAVARSADELGLIPSTKGRIES